MTILISCQSIEKAHGHRVLFKNLSFGVFEGDQIGLIGPNGAGKSTFLKILAEIEKADRGQITKRRNLHLSYVPQDSIHKPLSIEKVLLEEIADLPLEEQEKITRCNIVLSKLGFVDTEQLATSLSGGWKKRLDIAKALVHEPDLLLLDEPTNHLDLPGIIWLEQFLKKEAPNFIVISHDRFFLEKVCNKIAEINPVYPEGIFVTDGNYSIFLEKRESFLSAQLQIEQSLSSKVRREVEWLKQNPKARTTKSQARVQEAGRLIQELQAVKTRNRETGMNQTGFSSTDRGTKKLIVAKNISKSMGTKQLFSNVELMLSAGIRLGIVGGNGSGKTTFLKILSQEIEPDQGMVKWAEDLKIVYFDQHRQKIPDGVTLRQALAPMGDTLNYRGQKIHVSSWAKRFLFSSDILDMPVSQLSGGERARILIARLMLEQADVLLLDEPTNDLDINTLEVLEESLLSFPGAVVIISHDRYLLDRIANCILAIDLPTKEGMQENCFASYRQWQERLEKKPTAKPQEPKESVKAASATPTAAKKMSFKEKQELAVMEGKITALEKQIEQLENEINATLPGPALTELCHKLDICQMQLEQSYKRWQELESKIV